MPYVQSADLQAWATRVARLLFPGAIPPIPRQRWVNSLDSQAQYTLLANCHNLLSRVGPRWLARIAGNRPPPLPQLRLQSLPVVGPSSDPWEFSDDEPENDGAPVEELVEVDAGLVQSATGAEAEVKAIKDFNEKQRGRAAKFFESEPAHRLLVSVVCLGVAVAFLHAVESVSGSAWEMASWARCAEGGEHRSRMAAAASGGIQCNAMAKAWDIIFVADRWRALPLAGQTFGNAGLAFCMVSTFVCSIDQILLRFWRSWPYRMFLLLDKRRRASIAKEFLSAPLCLLDQWSQRSRKLFPTPSALLGDTCIAVLRALSRRDPLGRA